MNFKSILLLLATTALLQGCFLSRTVIPKVTGYVYDNESKTPIAGCDVSGFMTDSTGFYAFEEIRIRGIWGYYEVYSLDVEVVAKKEGYGADSLYRRAPYGGYSKGAHFEMDTLFLNREKQETPPQSDFLKIEKINENYAVGYKAYDEIFDVYSEMWILSADDTTAIDGIEANSCSIESVSPNGAYVVFATSTVRWDYYSDTDSALYHKWRAILVDLSSAEVMKHCPFDCGDHWNDDNQWLDGSEVIFDGAFPSVVPPFEAYYFSTDSTQLYDYSNLWDFDGDGMNDSLFFIGDGGAHLHFYPRIVLSSNAKVYEYTSFWLDMPYPDRTKEELMKSPAIQLVVDNFDDDEAVEIYLNIDGNNGYPYGNSYPKEWRKLGISTTSVLLNFENDTLILKDYGF